MVIMCEYAEIFRGKVEKYIVTFFLKRPVIVFSNMSKWAWECKKTDTVSFIKVPLLNFRSSKLRNNYELALSINPILCRIISSNLGRITQFCCLPSYHINCKKPVEKGRFYEIWGGGFMWILLFKIIEIVKEFFFQFP